MRVFKIILCLSIILTKYFNVCQATPPEFDPSLAHSASSFPSSSSSSSPSALHQMIDCTPLYREATEFLQKWEELKLSFTSDSTLTVFKDYIDEVIEVDQLRNFKDIRKLTYNVLDSEYVLNTENDYNKKYIIGSSSLFAILSDLLKDLLDKPSTNVFAAYFVGSFFAIGKEPKDYKVDEGETIKYYLDQSSKKHYERAINFLLENPLWRQKETTKGELKYRLFTLKNPLKKIYNFIAHHQARGQVSWEDIDALKHGLIYLTDHPAAYLQMYSHLAQKLTNDLILRKEKTSPFRLIEVPVISALSTGAVLTIQGVFNLAQSRLGLAPLQVLYESIGSAQIASAFVGIGATVATYPYVSNLFYKYENGGFKGKLLPASYSDEEISRQAHLISLYGIILDYNGILRKLQSKKFKKLYITQLRKITLNTYKDEDRALYTSIIQNDPKIYELKQGS